jgi:hypothetical protein
MIKIQLKPMKLESWVSGITVKHASITEIITAMVLRSEARTSGRRVQLFESGPGIGNPHATRYINDPPLIVTQDLPRQLMLRSLLLAGGFVSKRVDIKQHGQALCSIASDAEQ